MKRLGLAISGLALAGGLSACQTVREQEAEVKPEVALTYLSDKPAELKRHYYVALTQGKRNQVLNDMRLGLANMELGRFDLAEQMFDDALGGIETIYVNDENAAKARELFVKEAVKDFKGEPYERAMAYYYRGLLYLRGGDYDNARASFKGGFMQDSFADEDQNRADFGLFPFLQGWASRCRGNIPTANDDFAEFKSIRETFPLPAKGDDTLLLVETGSAPVKYSSAADGGTVPKFLKMRRASATESARFQLAAAPPEKSAKAAKQAAPQSSGGGLQTLPTHLLEDVYYQAATRGGREFDTLLAGKASFKDTTETIAKVATVAGVLAADVAMQSRNRKQQNDAAVAAGVLLLMAATAKIAAEAAEAEADTRFWDNLPDRIHAATFALPPGTQSITVDFLDSDGNPVRSRTGQVIKAGPCNLVWVRGETALPANPRAPYSAPKDQMNKPVQVPKAVPGTQAGVLPADRPKETAPDQGAPKS